jgi:hypothetical protein
MTNCEEFDGSSWTNTGALNVATGFSTAFGTQTDAVTQVNTPDYQGSEQYNGSTWTALPDIGVASPGGLYGASAGATGDSGMISAMSPTWDKTAEWNFTTNTVTAGAWASGGALGTARLAGASGGTQTAAFYAGGRVGPPGGTALSEEYDGSSWTEGNNLNTPRQYVEGAGTQTAGLAAGGHPASDATEEYNGTSWTSQPNSMGTARAFGGMAGAQTSAVYAGGNYPSTTVSGLVEEYNGTTWSEQNDLSQARKYLAAAGTADTDMMVFGGSDQPGGTKYTNTEEYDGTNWTNGGALITARQGLGGSPGGPGTKAGALAISGYDGSAGVASTEGYDGTAWSTRPSLATGRYDIRGAGGPTAALAIGGEAPGAPTIKSLTEEWTGETTALNVKTLTTS